MSEKPKKSAKKAYRLKDRFKVIFFSFLGLALVYVGIFAPAVEAPIYGVVSMYSSGEFNIEVFGLMVFSALAMYTALTGHFFWHKIYALIVVVCPFKMFIEPYFEEEKGFIGKIGEAISDKATDAAMNFITFSWGGLALIAGLFCFLISMMYSFNRKKAVEEKKSI